MERYLKSIYFLSPYWIQNLLISLKGFMLKKRRFDKHFLYYLNFYNDFSNKTSDIQNEIELERLREFIVTSSRSGYWKSKFSAYGIDIHASDIKKEIKKLPILYKPEVQKIVNSIVFNKEKLTKVKTSGTTGSGLVFYESKSSESERWALWWNYRQKNGIKLNQWYGWFGGMKIIATQVKQAPYWRINYPEKRVMFSAYHLNENTIDSYLAKIIAKKLSWLHGYPSQIALLASLALTTKNDLSFVKNVTFGAENLLDNQLDIIKKVFTNAKLTQHYGMAESVANISQYHSESLTLDRYFSYTEFVPTSEENKYWVVGTNLSNPNFPLIRYNTGDIVEISNGEIVSIDGRKEDYILLPDGTKLGRLDHIFKGLVNISESQIYQPTKQLIIFRVVKGELYDKTNEEAKLFSEIGSRFNEVIDWEVQYVNKINKTKSGKLRFVISDIK
jgi:phenylacetate-CoA ligase